MYKITIKGPAGKTNASDLSKLDGIDCQECFSDYLFSDRDQDKSLIDKGIESGYMEFEYNKNDGKLYVVVKYLSKEKLDDNEAKALIEYTQGQMSDGIGENFEQEPVMYEDDEEIFISPWFRGQKLEVTQTEL